MEQKIMHVVKLKRLHFKNKQTKKVATVSITHVAAGPEELVLKDSFQGLLLSLTSCIVSLIQCTGKTSLRKSRFFLYVGCQSCLLRTSSNSTTQKHRSVLGA